jgi:hypothetical protein
MVSCANSGKVKAALLSLQTGASEQEVLSSGPVRELISAIAKKNPMWSEVADEDTSFQAYATRVFSGIHNAVPPEIEEIKLNWWRDKRKYNKEVANNTYRVSMWLREMVVGSAANTSLEAAFVIAALFFYLQYINSVDPRMDLIRSMSVNDLETTVRVRNALVGAGINYVSEIELMTLSEVKRIKGLGGNSLKMLLETLESIGIKIVRT